MIVYQQLATRQTELKKINSNREWQIAFKEICLQLSLLTKGPRGCCLGEPVGKEDWGQSGQQALQRVQVLPGTAKGTGMPGSGEEAANPSLPSR